MCENTDDPDVETPAEPKDWPSIIISTWFTLNAPGLIPSVKVTVLGLLAETGGPLGGLVADRLAVGLGSSQD